MKQAWLASPSGSDQSGNHKDLHLVSVVAFEFDGTVERYGVPRNEDGVSSEGRRRRC